MLEQRGLNPEQWYIDSVTANQWDGPGAENKVTYYQTKFTAKRKVPMGLVRPARVDGWRPLRVYALDDPAKISQPRKVVIVGDQQAPFHDTNLHRLFVQWLEKNQPDEGVTLGDTLDFPDISRHPFDPDANATVNECIQAGYELLADYVAASPGTEWIKLVGNHDARLRDFVLKQARELYAIRRATPKGNEPEEGVLTLEHLLRLDELGIKLVDPHGGYEQGQYNLSSKLAVRHGWLAKPKSGATAVASLDHLGYSILVGHTHRQSLVHKTTHDIDGTPSTLAAAETGCMCVVQRTERNGRFWPNYSVSPDWQQGFACATIWDDGKFRIDLATYVNGVLLYQDQRYS